MVQRSGTGCDPEAQRISRPEMWSATSLPIAGVMNGSSACWTTRVGTRTVGMTARTFDSDTRGNIRATVRGLAARRSDGPTRPGSPRSTACPDLGRAATLPCPTYSDHRSEGFVSNPLGAVTRICVAFEHDKCGRARRMCRCSHQAGEDARRGGPHDRPDGGGSSRGRP
jgi:hypothetical protein